MKRLLRLSVRALAALLLILAATPLHAKGLPAPFGLQWGASPEAAHGALVRAFRDVGNENPLPDRLLYERRYEGSVLGMPSDHVAPLFFGARLFGVAASFSPPPSGTASSIWEALVERLTKELGVPQFRSKPQALLSWHAILRVLPPEANKSALLTLYNAAEKDPDGGKARLADLQVQVGLWIPEATWNFDGGAVVKALMRAAGTTAYGFTGLKPTVVYTSYEQLK